MARPSTASAGSTTPQPSAEPAAASPRRPQPPQTERPPQHEWLYGKPPPTAPVGGKARRSLPTAFPQSTPRFATLTELRRSRKQFAVHKSYDLDNSGAVSQREYFIASRFDVNKDGELQPKELAAARKAVKGGFGSDDFRDYFSYKRLNHSRFDRVLQMTCRVGSANYEDTFNRTIADFDTRNQHPEAEPPPVNTRSHLRSYRKSKSRHKTDEPAGAESRHPNLCEKRGAAPEATQAMLAEKAAAQRAATHGAAAKPVLREGFVTRPKHPTVQSLVKQRKQELIPDSSYDLDGDGVIAPRDYFLAKMFDKGYKHALDPAEREAALKAVANGLGKDDMDRYFGASRAPLTRTDKILQKTFQVRPKLLRHTYDRVIGDYDRRNDYIGTQAWGSTTQEALKMPYNIGTSDSGRPAIATAHASAPRLSGGWAGVPNSATPQGHWCHRASVHEKFRYRNPSAMH